MAFYWLVLALENFKRNYLNNDIPNYELRHFEILSGENFEKNSKNFSIPPLSIAVRHVENFSSILEKNRLDVSL